MSDPDIVTRLRESDGGYFMRRMFTEAADEIERLRAERDEARREVCSRVAYPIREMQPQPPRTMVEVAQERGWDCWRVPE